MWGLIVVIIILLIGLFYYVKHEFARTLIKFYRATCPACAVYDAPWSAFKRASYYSWYNTKEYDLDDPKNAAVAAKFNVKVVPTFVITPSVDPLFQLPNDTPYGITLPQGTPPEAWRIAVGNAPAGVL
jgi:hypothetical protein